MAARLCGHNIYKISERKWITQCVFYRCLKGNKRNNDTVGTCICARPITRGYDDESGFDGFLSGHSKGTPLGRSERVLESILGFHPLSSYGSKAKIAQRAFILRPRGVLGVWWVSVGVITRIHVWASGRAGVDHRRRRFLSAMRSRWVVFEDSSPLTTPPPKTSGELSGVFNLYFLILIF